MNGTCYDCFMAPLERWRIDAVRRDLVGGLRGRIVDLGAGTGANFPHFHPDAEVVAVEPDLRMLEKAQAGAGSRIKLVEGAAEALPVQEGWADEVVSTLVLCTVEDPVQSLQEITRVLKPGGRLHFLEHVRAEGAVGVINDLATPVWSKLAGGCRLNRRTLQVMEDCGFEIEWEVSFRLLGTPFVRGVARTV